MSKNIKKLFIYTSSIFIAAGLIAAAQIGSNQLAHSKSGVNIAFAQTTSCTSNYEFTYATPGSPDSCPSYCNGGCSGYSGDSVNGWTYYCSECTTTGSSCPQDTTSTYDCHTANPSEWYSGTYTITESYDPYNNCAASYAYNYNNCVVTNYCGDGTPAPNNDGSQCGSYSETTYNITVTETAGYNSAWTVSNSRGGSISGYGNGSAGFTYLTSDGPQTYIITADPVNGENPTYSNSQGGGASMTLSPPTCTQGQVCPTSVSGTFNIAYGGGGGGGGGSLETYVNITQTPNLNAQYTVSDSNGQTGHGVGGPARLIFDESGPTTFCVTYAQAVAGYSGPVITNNGSVQTCSPSVGTEQSTSFDLAYSQQQAPTVTLKANPTQVSSGGQSLLSWTSSNATSCAAPWTASTAPSGSQSVTVTANTAYTITCTGPGGKTSASAGVGVNPGSTINVTESPNLNGSWTITDGLGGSWTKSGTGSQSVAPPSGGNIYSISPASVSGYTVTVTNTQGGSNSMMVSPGETDGFTITYTPVPPPFDFSVTDSCVDQGNSPCNVSITESPVYTESQQELLDLHLAPGAGSSEIVAVTKLTSSPDEGNLIGYTQAPSSGCTPTCNPLTVNVTVAPSTPTGQYTITLTLAPPGGSPSHTFSFPLNVVPSPTLSLNCTASPTTVLVGNPVTWTANAFGGSGGKTYTWTGTDISPTAPSADNTYTITYTQPGTKTAVATVTDDLGDTANCSNSTATVHVNFNPNFKEF